MEALHLRIKEYRQELALCRKEAKRAARALKHAKASLSPMLPCPKGTVSSAAMRLLHLHHCILQSQLFFHMAYRRVFDTAKFCAIKLC